MLPQPPGLTSPSAYNEEVMELDDPNNDWQHIPNTAAVAFLFSFFVCALMSLFFFIFGSFDYANPIRALRALFVDGYIAVSLPMLVMVILHSFAIQGRFKTRFSRALGEILNISAHMAILTLDRLLFTGKFFPLVSVVLYVLYAVFSQLPHIKLA